MANGRRRQWPKKSLTTQPKGRRAWAADVHQKKRGYLMRKSLKTLSILCVAGIALATSSVDPAVAQARGKPFVVYSKGLQNGWQSWSWAKVLLDFDAGDIHTMRVEGDAWTGLLLHHDAFSTAGYTKLVFYINGGIDGGQALSVKAFADGKAIESNFQIAPKTKAWTKVEVPLKDLGANDRSIDSILIQGGGQPYKPYYITDIEFD